MRVSNVTVSVHAGRRPILGPLTTEFRPGEWAAVIGPNGAGKTTLCHVLTGAVQPDSGRVDNGVVVGFLAQAPPRPVGLTALEYSLLGVSLWGDNSEALVERANESLESCGVDAAQMVETLSGGEFRKAGIARVMTLDPDVMILDEPSAGLDPQARIDLFELIDSMREQRVLITVMHDLTTASQFGERLILLDEGKLQADGPVGEVISSEAFSSVFGESVRLVDVDGVTVPVMIR